MISATTLSPFLCTGLLRRNVHVAAELYIVGNDKADAFILLVGYRRPHGRRVPGSSRRLPHGGGRRKQAEGSHLDFVLIQRTADKIRRNKISVCPEADSVALCFFLIRNNKTEAARISDKSTRQNFHDSFFFAAGLFTTLFLK